MKFTDGMWLWRPGVTALRPVEVDAVVAGSASLTVYATTVAVTSRGDTLNRALLTLEFTAVAEGVIRVRATHLAGGVPRRPEFALALPDDPGEHGAVVTDECARLSAGCLSVEVARRGPWAVRFLQDGRELTASLAGGLAFLDVPVGTCGGERLLIPGPADGGAFVREQLELAPGERIYGLGERFGPFIKNGQSVDAWLQDGGTASEQAYKAPPFYLSSAGYGVLVDDPGHVSFEIGSEDTQVVQFSVPGQTLDYVVFAGPTPKDVLRRYTGLTGRPPLVPAWSYGVWLSTSFTTDYDEATVMAAVDEMTARGLPVSVVHFDCFWMREYQWCDFTWDDRTFPDPVGLLHRLHDRGLRVCVWINPYIAQRSPLFAEGAAQGFLLKTTDGGVWQWDLWQAGMGLVDFTNPDAVAWWTGKLEVLLDQGVDCFKTDFGERIPVDGVAWFDGADPARMHNLYTSLYNRCVFELLERRRGHGEAVLFARSATAGGQQWPVHWGGDSWSTYTSMAETLRGGLSLALSGFAYWSHDIGGFEGTPPADVFTRWCAFGLLSSHSRFHGSGSMRLPWLYGEAAVETVRRFTALKLALMPYLEACAREAAATGTPLLRPMVLEFPDDRGAREVDSQYMLGPSLLVAPVFTADGAVDVFVPEGTWRSLLDQSVVDGHGGWVRQVHDLTSLPLLQRPDSVVVLGARSDTPEYDWADGVTLRCSALADGHDETVVIPAADAGVGAADAAFRVRRTGDRVGVETDSARAWALWIDGDLTEYPAGTPAAECRLGKR